MNFKLLNEYSDEQVYVSDKLNNGSFNYWLVISAGEIPGENVHYCMAQVVAPSRLSKKKLDECLDGYEPRDKITDLMKVEAVQSYMGGALLWQDTGPDVDALIEEAKKQAALWGGTLFGFAMDKPQNALGTTGWDVLKGNYWGVLGEDK